MRGELHVIALGTICIWVRMVVIHTISYVRSFVHLYDFDGAGEIRLKLRLPTEELNE